MAFQTQKSFRRLFWRALGTVGLFVPVLSVIYFLIGVILVQWNLLDVSSFGAYPYLLAWVTASLMGVLMIPKIEQEHTAIHQRSLLSHAGYVTIAWAKYTGKTLGQRADRRLRWKVMYSLLLLPVYSFVLMKDGVKAYLAYRKEEKHPFKNEIRRVRRNLHELEEMNAPYQAIQASRQLLQQWIEMKVEAEDGSAQTIDPREEERAERLRAILEDQQRLHVMQQTVQDPMAALEEAERKDPTTPENRERQGHLDRAEERARRKKEKARLAHAAARQKMARG